jgi:hypothetical protein
MCPSYAMSSTCIGDGVLPQVTPFSSWATATSRPWVSAGGSGHSLGLDPSIRYGFIEGFFSFSGDQVGVILGRFSSLTGHWLLKIPEGAFAWKMVLYSIWGQE